MQVGVKDFAGIAILAQRLPQEIVREASKSHRKFVVEQLFVPTAPARLPVGLDW
jgi:hypothetical protein